MAIDLKAEEARIFFHVDKATDPGAKSLTIEKEKVLDSQFQWIAYQLLFSFIKDGERKFYVYDVKLHTNGTEEKGAVVFDSDSRFSGKNKDKNTKDITPEEVKINLPRILKGPELFPDLKVNYVNTSSSDRKVYSSEEFKNKFDTDYFIVLDPGKAEMKNPFGKIVGKRGEPPAEKREIMAAHSIYLQAVKNVIEAKKKKAPGFDIMQQLVQTQRKHMDIRKKESLLNPIIDANKKRQAFTKRLDKIATDLENDGNVIAALIIDKVSDVLEVRAKDKSQLEIGIEIEKEHSNVYDLFKKYLQENDLKMPVSKDEFFKMIAESHLEEVSDYYKKLLKYVEPEE